jgi:hypothetical protein
MSGASPKAAVANIKPTAPPTHPAARYVSKLFGGGMAQCDQKWGYSIATWVITLSAVIGYALGYYMETFLYTTYVVLGGCAFSLLVCGPNWRQRQDGHSEKWVSGDVAARYYEDLNHAEEMHAAQEKRKPLKHHM